MSKTLLCRCAAIRVNLKIEFAHKFVLKLKTPTECFKFLKEVFNDNCKSHSHIFEWNKRFSEDQEVDDDDERSDRSLMSRTGHAHRLEEVNAKAADLLKMAIPFNDGTPSPHHPQHCFVRWKTQMEICIGREGENEKVSNHGSIPITIDCNVVAFIVFEEGFHQPIKRTKQSVFLDVTVFRHTLVVWISFTPKAAVLFVDVAIQPEVRFIAKQNSLMKIENNGNLVLGPFDECLMIVLMNCQTKLRINHLTAVKSVAILETLESDEQRALRLENLRVHATEIRSSESSDQREVRLETDRIRTNQIRYSEITELRERRLQNVRISTARSRRTLHADLNLSAFHYDSNNDYSLHPNVVIGKMDKICMYCSALNF
ncbi:hypothetical protein TNCV_4370511 [Trichonephila clavipes]|uniref:Mos1 transposase HTH domain-containing protein n=1 Tax=Trichonephila clavipes TaxID=2585209 RepID=A0A8X6SBP7_TRICX|nr:hypothetical protein TNCV_4370511 [Trichonephila clavipes]